jgi:hypothetical protein
VPLQSVRGAETALQDEHSCKAPPASGPTWCIERLDTGNNAACPYLNACSFSAYKLSLN